MGIRAHRLMPRVGGLLLGAFAVAALAASNAEATLSNATWTGGSDSSLWSNAEANGLNWFSGNVPSSPLDVLSFPDLGSCDPSTHTCYASTDDLGAVTANQLSIDNAQSYDLEPTDSSDSLTLMGNGGSPNVGLATNAPTAFLGVPYISIPITLGADQAWTIGGDVGGASVQYVTNVSGNHTLDLQLSGGAQLFATSLATGALTVEGNGELFLTNDSNNDAVALPTAGVTMPDGTSNAQPAVNDEASGAATSGGIDASAATHYGNQLTVGTAYSIAGFPESWLHVTGDVTLGSVTAFGFSIDGNDTTPAATEASTADASEMTVTGNVDLGGARFGMSQGYVDSGTQDCVNLTPGNTYTVLTATGTITGSYSYAVGNDFVGPIAQGTTSPTPTTFGPNCNGATAEAYINYGSHSITETIAGSPSSTAAPAISGTAQVGQTLTAGDGTWSGYPAPNYTYQWMACASGSCSPISGATGSTFVVTSAQEGKTLEVQVTATNSLGNAMATSAGTGAVPTPTITTTTTTTTTPTPTTTTTTTTTTTPTLPTGTQVSSALSGIGHPTGNKAITALIKAHDYKTSLMAPSAGTVSVVWTTVVRTGKGKHRKHRTVTVGTGTGTASGPGGLSVTIHLTTAGRALVKKTPRNLHITDTEKFEPSGGSWTTLVKHFTL